MPYTLQKKKGASKFWVTNKSTGHKFSKLPLSLKKARKQLIAIELNTTERRPKTK